MQVGKCVGRYFHVCTHVCICASVYVCLSVCMHVCMYACMFVMYVGMCVCMPCLDGYAKTPWLIRSRVWNGDTLQTHASELLGPCADPNWIWWDHHQQKYRAPGLWLWSFVRLECFLGSAVFNRLIPNNLGSTWRWWIATLTSWKRGTLSDLRHPEHVFAQRKQS